MNNNLKKLEYDKILEKIAHFCKTYLGKKYAFNLRPSQDVQEVQKSLNETSQGVVLIQRNSTPPIGEIADITIYLKTLDGCGSLSIKALIELQNILQMAEDLKEYFSKDLAGKDATFHIKMHEIKEKELPKIDDEFAKDVSEFDTLAELKKDIKSKQEKDNEHRAKHEMEDAAIEAVCENTKIDIPEGMIDMEIDNMIDNISQRLQYQGITLDQYLKMMGKTMDDVRKEFKTDAEKNVKSKLVLDQIVAEEKIEADAKYVKEKIEEMAKQYNKKVEELESNENLKSYLEEESKTEAAIKFLIDNAKLTK